MRWLGLSVTALGLVAATLAAQDPQCNVLNANATRACNTAVDAVRAFHPLAGMIVSGGNPVLGSAGSLGGLGHVSVTARVNALKVSLPNPDSAIQSSVPSSFDGVVPAPVVDVAVGVLDGLGGGLLSLDALGSAVLLPTGVVSDLSVESGAAHIGSVAFGLGYGVRVGALRGSFPVPALSLSVMRRTVPRIRYGRLPPICCTAAQFEFDTDLRATNVRVAAGFRFVLLDVAAGFGFDKYTSTAHIRFYETPPANTVRTVTLSLDNSRQVLFVDAGVHLALVKFVAELGYQTGKDQQLSTSFSDFDPTSGHVFGGIGFRFTF